jgi:sugar phosphate isomerase/epimerase
VSLPFQLGIVTDEIDPDLDRALSVAAELGLGWVELNTVWGRSITELAPDEVARARRLIAAAGARVVAVDPPAFKTCELPRPPRGGVARDPEVRRHLEMVRHAAGLAQQFGARLVRVFSFRRGGMAGLGNPSPRLAAGGPLPDDILDRIAEGLAAALEVAEAEAVVLGLENVRSCWANSGENAARVLSRLGSPRLRAIWDPANAYVSGGVPDAEGYEAVRPFLDHVHVKDARVLDADTGLTSWEAVGSGEVNWPTQLAALERDGYAGVLSLETHWRPANRSAEAATRGSLAGLRRLLAAMAPPAGRRAIAGNG